MKITVDTAEDSPEELERVARFILDAAKRRSGEPVSYASQDTTVLQQASEDDFPETTSLAIDLAAEIVELSPERPKSKEEDFDDALDDLFSDSDDSGDTFEIEPYH